MFTLITAHQVIGGNFCFLVYLADFCFTYNFCNIKVYHETFTVMDNMLQSPAPDHLQEFILTVYLCIKGTMYPDSLSRILLRLQH